MAFDQLPDPFIAAACPAKRAGANLWHDDPDHAQKLLRDCPLFG